MFLISLKICLIFLCKCCYYLKKLKKSFLGVNIRLSQHITFNFNQRRPNLNLGSNMGGSPLNCIKFLKIELKPVFGGFEPQLKFIKFGHFYFTFRNKKKPRDIAQSIIFKWLTSKLVKIIFKNIKTNSLEGGFKMWNFWHNWDKTVKNIYTV